jgi:hypothetical protein
MGLPMDRLPTDETVLCCCKSTEASWPARAVSAIVIFARIEHLLQHASCGFCSAVKFCDWLMLDETYRVVLRVSRPRRA